MALPKGLCFVLLVVFVLALIAGCVSLEGSDPEALELLGFTGTLTANPMVDIQLGMTSMEGGRVSGEGWFYQPDPDLDELYFARATLTAEEALGTNVNFTSALTGKVLVLAAPDNPEDVALMHVSALGDGYNALSNINAVVTALQADIDAVFPGNSPTDLTFSVGSDGTGRLTITSHPMYKAIAAPNRGFRFAHWLENDVEVSTDAEYIFEVEEGVVRELTAHFEPIWVARLAGNNRYQTAATISQEGFETANYVLLARGDDFPDSLAGVTLAYMLDAPILLTPSNRLHNSTKLEIERLGASNVIILGGAGAISEAVEAALLEINNVNVVSRIAGTNRYDTARLIAKEINKLTKLTTAILTSGLDFPDALAAASYGARRGNPVLLTRRDSLPQATIDALDSISGIDRIVIVGGEGVISSTVEDALRDRGLTVVRISGANRYATSVELAKEYLPGGAEHIFIATGLDFPDALAGGVLAARRNSGILLVRGDRPTSPMVVDQFIYNRGINRATILGGPSAVSEELANHLELLLRGLIAPVL